MLAPHVLSLGSRPASSVHRPSLPPQDPRASLPTFLRDQGRPLNRCGSHTDHPLPVIPGAPPLSPPALSSPSPLSSSNPSQDARSGRDSVAQAHSTQPLRANGRLHHMSDIDEGPPRRLPFRIRAIQHLFRRPAQLRAWATRSSAPRRHRIWKVTLADTLCNLLDYLKAGVLGTDELLEFSLLTGSQGHSDELHDLVAHLLDTWGSPLGSRFDSNRICMPQFRRIVSRPGPLHMRKFELRRTVRFARALAPAWPVTLHEFSLRR